MARRRGSRMVLDFSDLRTFTDTIQRLERSRTYYSEGGKQRLRQFKSEVQSQFMNPMLQELGFEPGDSPPGNFAKRATPRQKRYYWWAVSQGLIQTDANGKYIRTHELSGGWVVEVDLTFGRRNVITLRTHNKKRYSLYVVGRISLGKTQKSVKNYLQPVQKFHRYTGWMPASPIIQKYYAAARAYIRQELIKWGREGLP